MSLNYAPCALLLALSALWLLGGMVEAVGGEVKCVPRNDSAIQIRLVCGDGTPTAKQIHAVYIRNTRIEEATPTTSYVRTRNPYLRDAVFLDMQAVEIANGGKDEQADDALWDALFEELRDLARRRVELERLRPAPERHIQGVSVPKENATRDFDRYLQSRLDGKYKFYYWRESGRSVSLYGDFYALVDNVGVWSKAHEGPRALIVARGEGSRTQFEKELMAESW